MIEIVDFAPGEASQYIDIMPIFSSMCWKEPS